MNTRQLLQRVGGGLRRRDLYYLESQDLVKPLKHRTGNVWHRDWPESLIPVLKMYIAFKKEGFKVSAAWERAQKRGA